MTESVTSSSSGASSGALVLSALRDPIEAWLSAQHGSPVNVTDFRRLATGNSRMMLTLALADGRRFVR